VFVCWVRVQPDYDTTHLTKYVEHQNLNTTWHALPVYINVSGQVDTNVKSF
jgi:hypothetical protein